MVDCIFSFIINEKKIGTLSRTFFSKTYFYDGSKKTRLNEKKIGTLSRTFFSKTYSYDGTKRVRLNNLEIKAYLFRYFMTDVKLILYTIRRKN